MIADPYRVLGLSRKATALEIKKAYFTLVREHSPERDPEGFKRIVRPTRHCVRRKPAPTRIASLCSHRHLTSRHATYPCRI